MQLLADLSYWEIFAGSLWIISGIPGERLVSRLIRGTKLFDVAGSSFASSVDP